MAITKLKMFAFQPEFNKENAFSHPEYCLLKKSSKWEFFIRREKKDLENLPSTFMICHLNGLRRGKAEIDHKVILRPPINLLT
jgi:hypothetical protein